MSAARYLPSHSKRHSGTLRPTVIGDRADQVLHRSPSPAAARLRPASTSAARDSRAPAPAATRPACARSMACVRPCTSAGSEAASSSSTGGNFASSMRAWAGRNCELLHQPALHPQTRHPLEGQRQHRVKTVFKSQVDQLARRHPQRQRAKCIHEQARQQRRSTPPGHEIRAAAPDSSTAAPAPASPDARSRPPWRISHCPSRPARCARCASSAPRSCAGVIQPCSSISRPSGTRWRCVSSRATAPVQFPAHRGLQPLPACTPAEQLHPPSNTGVERLRQTCSQPERQAGLAQVSRSPCPIRRSARRIARPRETAPPAGSDVQRRSGQATLRVRALRLKRGIVCSPDACAALQPRSPASRSCR